MPGDEVAEVTVYVFLSDHFVKTVYVSKNMNNVVMATVTYKKNDDVTGYTDHVINCPVN